MPPRSLDVQARLEGDHVAGLERVTAFRDEVGRLGVPEAQPVARMRREILVESQRREVTTNGGVDVAGGRAGFQCGLARVQRTDARVE